MSCGAIAPSNGGNTINSSITQTLLVAALKRECPPQPHFALPGQSHGRIGGDRSGIVCLAYRAMVSLKSFKGLKVALPFLSFMVMGSFFLREFATIRYDLYKYKNKHMKIRDDEDEDEAPQTPEQLQQRVAKAKAEEEDLQAFQQMGVNDTWKNIRGPRPWEDNREYNELMESLKAKQRARGLIESTTTTK